MKSIVQALELQIPPPIIMAVFGAIAWLIAKYLSAYNLSIQGVFWFSLGLASVGFMVAALGIIEFLKAKTTINPHSPANTSLLVQDGIYRVTRNPMYIGLFLVLVAWQVYIFNFLSLICLPLFLVCVTWLQILPEERILQEKFGSEFSEYMTRVGRWI